MTTLAPKLPYSHPFSGGYPRIGGQPLPTDPDAIDYLNRQAAVDGPVEVGVAMAVDQFVKGCKADSAGYAGDPTRTVWDALQACCIMCGARTISGALVPLVGPAPTPYNFTASDYDRSTGLVGDGSTTYIDLQDIYQGSQQQNSAHQSVFITSQTTSAIDYVTHIREPDDGVIGGDGQTQISQRVGSTFTRCREGSGETLVATIQTGLTGIARQSASEYVRRTGGSSATIPDISSGVPSGDGHVFYNGAIQHSDARMAFFSFGEYVTLSSLDNRVSTLISSISTALA